MTNWQGALLVFALGAIACLWGSSTGPGAWDAFNQHPDGHFESGSGDYQRFTPGLIPWVLLRATGVPRRLAGVVYGLFWALLVMGFLVYVWVGFIR